MAACAGDRSRKPAKTNSARLRFSFQDGLDLLREVRAANAVQDLSQWTTVRENVGRATGKAFSLRAVRDHFDLLLAQFKKDDRANLQKSGTEEGYSEKEQLLQELLELAQEANYPIRDRRPPSVLAAERDSSAAARDEAAAEHALELEVCTDVPAPHTETAQDILYGILGRGSPTPIHLEYDAPSTSANYSPPHCVEPEIVPPATPNSAAVNAPLEPPRRQFARKRRETRLSADHAFLEKKWHHEQLLRDKENAIEVKRLELENNRLALERERLQQEAAIRFEEFKARAEDRRDREEQRRQSAANQAAFLDIIKTVLGEIKKN